MDSCLLMSITSTYMHFFANKTIHGYKSQMDFPLLISDILVLLISVKFGGFSSQHITYGTNFRTSVPLRSLLILFKQDTFSSYPMTRG